MNTAARTIAPQKAMSDYAQKLKVCGHPLRLALLCTIAHQNDLCVSELWECVDQPQPVVSQHLAVLKEKGLVKSEVQGNKRIYSIADPFVKQMIDLMEQDHRAKHPATALAPAAYTSNKSTDSV